MMRRTAGMWLAVAAAAAFPPAGCGTTPLEVRAAPGRTASGRAASGQAAGGFVDAATGRPLTIRGFNYLRLENPKGGKHTTFAPGAYDPKAAGRMLATLQANGFNAVRVFISAAHTRPGSLFPKQSDTELSKAYMDNVADLLRQARRHRVLVVLSFEFLPLTDRYIGLAGREPSRVVYMNRMLLDPGYIRARQAFLADFVRAIRARGPELLRAVLAYDLQNELCFHMSYPFDQAAGTFTAPNGRTYDLAKDKAALADDAAVYWVDAMTDAIKGVDPDARTLVSVFTYRAVGRTGPGDFSPKAAAWQNRYPFRPAALVGSKAGVLSVHFYPKDADEFRAGLRSVEFDTLKPAAAKAGKVLLCTEFGAFKAAHPDAAGTARWLAELQGRILDAGFAGWLHWQYDTHEQPRLWNAAEHDGLILKALAAGRRR